MTNYLVTRCSIVLFPLAALCSGCADQSQSESRADAIALSGNRPDSEAAGADPARQWEFDERLLEIAQSYESYGRVHVDFRWALADCVISPDVPELARSASTDSRAHGRKIYALYAKLQSSPGMYIPDETTNPVGQVVVKESWVPEEFDPEAEGERAPPARTARRRGEIAGSDDSSITSQTIVLDGRHFRPKEKGDLFIMIKLNPATPGTDEGWVYGTVTGDGKKVTSAGRVASCMSCHLEAPHDRLFGPHLATE